MKLPPLPGHRIEVVRKLPSDTDAKFVEIDEQEVRMRFADGARSEPFRYSTVVRAKLDAVVVAPHFVGADGQRMVVLRSAFRPPAALRPMSARPIEEKASLGELWELPAGLVEPDETSPEGLKRCAARELFEETGCELAPESMQPLGPAMFPAPAVLGERHFFFHAVVDWSTRVEPPLDGSILERQASIVAVPLAAALEACASGEIEDEKTELALRRLRAL